MSDPRAPSPDAPGRSRMAWPIAFGVVATLLLVTLLYLVLRDDDQATTGGTVVAPVATSTSTSVPATTTTTAATPEVVAGPDCDAQALSAAIAASGSVDGTYTIDGHVCSPAVTTGAYPRAYAWARATIDSPEPIEPANTFFIAVAQPDLTWGSWQLLSLGTGQTCDQVIDAFTDTGQPVCDLFPEAPRS